MYQGTQAEFSKAKPKLEKYYAGLIQRKGAEYRYEIAVDSLMYVGIIKTILAKKLEKHEKDIEKIKKKVEIEDEPEPPTP